MFYMPKSSLELTFDLIRQVQPSLALKVRNATLEPCLDKDQKRIAMNISEEDIFVIVNQLMLVENQARMGAKADKGRQILASALIADWLTLNIDN
jgi:hypothetical protein